MKKFKEIKSNKTQNGNDNDIKRTVNLGKEKSPIWPQEFEEQRSMNIRMKEQALSSTAKPGQEVDQK